MLHVLCVRVANSPGLTRKLEVSAFDLQAPGFELQSPDYTANCMKNPLPDHFGVISVVTNAPKSYWGAYSTPHTSSWLRDLLFPPQELQQLPPYNFLPLSLPAQLHLLNFDSANNS